MKSIIVVSLIVVVSAYIMVISFSDFDGDGVRNYIDNCPSKSNFFQINLDGDEFGDLCDPDIDNDSVPNSDDEFMYDEKESRDSDKDGIGDNSDK